MRRRVENCSDGSSGSERRLWVPEYFRRGVEPEGTELVRVSGLDDTLIVGGLRVER